MNKPEMINISLPREISNVRFISGTATVSNRDRQQQPGELSPEAIAQLQAAQLSRQAELLDEVHEAVMELEQRRQSSLQELQEVAVELAAAAAAELTCQLIDRDQYAIDELVQRIFDQLPLKSPAVLCVHPRDLEKLQTLLNERSDKRGDVTLELKADSSISPGGCRLAAESGMLAISEITQRLAEIRLGWLEELKHAQTERRQAQGSDQGLQRFPDRRDTA